ncbi:hypothetical protein INT45_004080 [Circinella minor]|uniref:Uncharacterized protein n=1 Tax=Circinella minor TaxID=1195481 RepID=A0A8H7RTW6_9FUNG|nr:hypothetical protein INT45_004080 [Circinella minor]
MEPLDDRPISPWTRTMDRLYSPNENNNNASSSSPNNNNQQDNDHYRNAEAMTTDIPLPQETAIPGPRRKRNNSLIPPELMNDNSEGGRERAALATVFGVREYTESKIFWERQVANYYQPSTSTTTATTLEEDHDTMHGNGSIHPTSISNTVDESIKNHSVMSYPIPSSSSQLQPTPSTSNNNNNNKQVISSLFDSAFENVGNRSTLPVDPTTSRQMKSSGTKTVEFSLPDIPVVSQFSDLFTDTTLDMKTTRHLKDKKLPRPVSFTSSIFEEDPSHYPEVASIPPSIISENQYSLKKYDTIAPPLVFTNYPPAIFDLLTSDEDERIIIWGLDPQVLSASMATTSAAGKKLSLDETPTPTPSTLTTPSLASVQSVPTNPNIKGFSSNTTTTTSTSESTPSTTKRLMKPRWSSQFLSEKLSKTSLPLIKNKHHLPRYGTPIPDSLDEHYKEKSGSILFKFARKQSMRVGKGKRVNAIMEDDQRSVQSMDVPKVIEAATVEKLVEKLTMSLGY